jgi:hypothetical protein
MMDYMANFENVIDRKVWVLESIIYPAAAFSELFGKAG